MTATGTPRLEGSTGRPGLALPWANSFESGLRNIPLPLHIHYDLRTNVCRSSRHYDKDGAYRRWRTHPTIDGDFVEVQQSQPGDTAAASINCNQFAARLQFAVWADLQLLRVGWSDIHAIAWIKITCSRGRIMDLDLKIACHIDGSLSGYFLMMDDLSSDYGTAMKSQWKTDIMEVSNNDIYRAYRAIGEVTECGPYERNYAHGGIAWLQPTGSLSYRDRGQRRIAAGDG